MDNAVFSIIFFCSSMAVGYACSCAPATSPAQYCARDMIFRGKALAEYTQRDESNNPSVRVYTMQVDEVFWAKDEFSRMNTITVTTAFYGSLCGVSFVLDAPYLFSVMYDNTSTERRFRTGLCYENTLWDNVEEPDRWFISNLIPAYCSRQNTNSGTATEP